MESYFPRVLRAASCRGLSEQNCALRTAFKIAFASIFFAWKHSRVRSSQLLQNESAASRSRYIRKNGADKAERNENRNARRNGSARPGRSLSEERQETSWQPRLRESLEALGCFRERMFLAPSQGLSEGHGTKSKSQVLG